MPPKMKRGGGGRIEAVCGDVGKEGRGERVEERGESVPVTNRKVSGSEDESSPVKILYHTNLSSSKPSSSSSPTLQSPVLSLFSLLISSAHLREERGERGESLAQPSGREFENAERSREERDFPFPVIGLISDISWSGNSRWSIHNTLTGKGKGEGGESNLSIIVRECSRSTNHK
jgi:hypothetical protein